MQLAHTPMVDLIRVAVGLLPIMGQRTPGQIAFAMAHAAATWGVEIFGSRCDFYKWGNPPEMVAEHNELGCGNDPAVDCSEPITFSTRQCPTCHSYLGGHRHRYAGALVGHKVNGTYPDTVELIELDICTTCLQWIETPLSDWWGFSYTDDDALAEYRDWLRPVCEMLAGRLLMSTGANLKAHNELVRNYVRLDEAYRGR